MAKEAYSLNCVNWSDIIDHLPLLRRSAKGNCMEIGVRSGVSTSALLAGLEESGGHLWSVDINHCIPFAGHPQWTFMQADSIKEFPRVNAAIPDKLNLLFVDGDHSYEGCLADLDNYGGRAEKILVHDTSAPDYPGVRKAVEDYCSKTGRSLSYYEGSYGMAEIR